METSTIILTAISAFLIGYFFCFYTNKDYFFRQHEEPEKENEKKNPESIIKNVFDSIKVFPPLPLNFKGPITNEDFRDFMRREIKENISVIYDEEEMKPFLDLKLYQKMIRKRIEKKVNTGNPEEIYALNILLTNSESWFGDRKKWFLDMVGQKIYPDKLTCLCDGCRDDYENGILIKEKKMAHYYFAYENKKKLDLEEMEYSMHPVNK